MVLWAVMSTILVLLTVSTHPSDSVYTLQYQGGTFLVDRSQYQQLADAFLHGRTWIDAHVPDWLAAMDNPYDEQARGTLGAQTGDASRWDWAFYHGRYYCYFGPLPALLLFAPFKALTGTDRRPPQDARSLRYWHALRSYSSSKHCGSAIGMAPPDGSRSSPAPQS